MTPPFLPLMVNLIPEQVFLIFLGVYAGLSLLTFLIYWKDKSAARHGTWRTPESTLHLLALAGGWPGAFIAQRVLRHKTQKRSFRVVFWLTVLLHCAGAGWLLVSFVAR